MEREPIEPAVDAVEFYKEEQSQRHRNWSVALIALGCSLLGAGAVLAAVRFAPHWFSPDPKQVVIQTPKENPVPPPTAHKLYGESKDAVAAPVTTEGGAPAKVSTKPAPGKPAQGTSSDTTPLNPFSGAIISRTPLPEGWSAGSETPTPKDDPTPGPSTARKPIESVLVTIRTSSNDPEAEAASMASILQASGASVRSASHYNAAGSPIGVQIVATLPARSLDSALAKVGSGDRWTGEPADRAREVASIFSGRLRELRTREVQLREKYEDDATELVVIREEIQKLNQGLAMARAAKSPGVAVILIGIGDL